MKCAICFRKLDNPGKFPDDFPDEWKMCCNCHGYAKFITSYNLEDIIGYFRDGDSGMDKNTFIRRAKKINKLISVV